VKHLDFMDSIYSSLQSVYKAQVFFSHFYCFSLFCNTKWWSKSAKYIMITKKSLICNNSVTTQQCHNTTQHNTRVSQHNSVTTQVSQHNTTVSQHNTTVSQHNTTVSQHNGVTTQQCHNTCHNSKSVIFSGEMFKGFEVL